MNSEMGYFVECIISKKSYEQFSRAFRFLVVCFESFHNYDDCSLRTFKTLLVPINNEMREQVHTISYTSWPDSCESSIAQRKTIENSNRKVVRSTPVRSPRIFSEHPRVNIG